MGKGIHYRDGGGGRSKAEKRAELFRKQRGKCAICNGAMSMDTATLDHIIPKSKGGGNALKNLRLAHKACNHSRGASVDDLFVDAAGLVALRWNVRELP